MNLLCVAHKIVSIRKAVTTCSNSDKAIKLLWIKAFNFVNDTFGILLVNVQKAFFTAAKIINIARINVKPKRMYMQIVTLQALLQESVRCHIRHWNNDWKQNISLNLFRKITSPLRTLFQSVDLRQFVLNIEFILWIDVSDELSQRRFRWKDQWIFHASLFPF